MYHIYDSCVTNVDAKNFIEDRLSSFVVDGNFHVRK